MSDDILYLHCRAGIEKGKSCPLDALVFEGDLMIVCREHGAVHVQPFVGPPLTGCQHPAHVTKGAPRGRRAPPAGG